MNIRALIEKTFDEDEGAAEAAYELYRYFLDGGQKEKAAEWLERAEELGWHKDSVTAASQKPSEDIKEQESASGLAQDEERQEISALIREADKTKSLQSRAAKFERLITMLENRPEYSTQLYQVMVKAGQAYAALRGKKTQSENAKKAYQYFQNASELKAAEEDPDQYKYLMECRKEGIGCTQDSEIYMSLLAKHLGKSKSPVQILKSAREYENSKTERPLVLRLLKQCARSDQKLYALTARFRLDQLQNGKKNGALPTPAVMELLSEWTAGTDIFKVLDDQDEAALLSCLGNAYQKMPEDGRKALAENAMEYYCRRAVQAKAVEWAKKAAEGGSHSAEVLLYLISPRAGIVPNDETVAEEAEKGNLAALELRGRKKLENHDAEGALSDFKKASQSRLFCSHEQYGQVLLEHGDTEKAVRMYEKAASRGSRSAAKKLTVLFGSGEYIPQDAAKVWKYTVRAADLHDAESQLTVGKKYLEDGDYAGASKYLDGCAADSPEALFLIGTMKAEGTYQGKNEEAASAALIRASEAGKCGIEEQIGDALKKEGLYEAAGEWYRKALDAGADTEEALFRLYEGELKDSSAALPERIRICESILSKGNREAAVPLANLYLRSGRIREALDIYIKEAENGNREAAEILGDYYFDGRIINRVPEKAEYYYLKCAVPENTKVCARLGELLWLKGECRRAAGYYESCAADYPLLGVFLGRQYMTGRHFGPDLNKAVKLFRQASDPGSQTGEPGICASEQAVKILAGLYLDRSIKPDGDTLKIYERAAHLGDAECAAEAAEKYWNGEGVPEDRKKAFGYYRIAADAGCTEAQRVTGICLLKGTVTKADPSSAFRYLSPAAEQSDPEALYFLGTMYEEGNGTQQDAEKAFELYRRAADAGWRPAVKKTADMYLNGTGTAEDAAAAMKYLDKLIDAGDADAMHKAAMVLIGGSGTAEADRTRALALLNRLKDMKYPEAYTELGVIYLDGIYVKKDLNAAEQLLREAVRYSDTTAMFRLADLLDEKGDHARAFEMIEKLCAMGVKTAYFTAAERCRKGLGTNANIVKARKYYQKAAAAGNAYAYIELAETMEIDPKPADYQAGRLMWYRMAAEAGLAAGYEKMAECFEYGRGTVFDIIRAVELYHTALTKKDGLAGYRLAEIYRTGRGGISPDLPLAEATYQEAGELGWLPAYAALADMYMNEPGFTDYRKAFACAQYGAENGDPACMTVLAKMYNTGTGTEKNRVEALKWTAKASALRTGGKISEVIQPDNTADIREDLPDKINAGADKLVGAIARFWRKI